MASSLVPSSYPPVPEPASGTACSLQETGQSKLNAVDTSAESDTVSLDDQPWDPLGIAPSPPTTPSAPSIPTSSRSASPLTPTLATWPTALPAATLSFATGGRRTPQTSTTPPHTPTRLPAPTSPAAARGWDPLDMAASAQARKGSGQDAPHAPTLTNPYDVTRSPLGPPVGTGFKKPIKTMPRLQLKPVSEWVQDEVVTHCVVCQVDFSLFNRKHHCRVCGHIFCHFCSSKTLPMPPPSYESVRVCDNCYADHQQAIVKNDMERKTEKNRNCGSLSPLTREVLEHLLVHLPCGVLVHAVPLVCRELYFLSRGNAVWQLLYSQRWKLSGVQNVPNARVANWLYYQSYQRQHMSEQVKSNMRLQRRVKNLLSGNIKMLMIGASGIGKTCLLQRFITGEYRKQNFGTVGVTQRVKPVQIPAGILDIGPVPTTTNLVLYDCSGDPRYSAMLPLYYSNAHAICIFYDVTSLPSLTVAEQLCKDFQTLVTADVVIAICGLKIDCVHRVVGSERVSQIPYRHDFVYECSALYDRNVTGFFGACVNACLQKILSTPNAAVPLAPPSQTPVDILCNPKWQL